MNATNLQISNLIAKIACKKSKLYETAKEFQLIIGLTYVLKLLICCVSVFSGFAFFKYSLSKFFDNPLACAVLSAVILLTVEYIVNSVLEKMFKFVFKKMFKRVAGLFALSVLFFCISFYISTAGISLYMTDTTGETVIVNQRFSRQKDSLQSCYDSQLERYQTEIETISRQTWKGKLSQENMTTVSGIYDKIEQLEQQRKTELKDIDERCSRRLGEITAAADVDAKEYYWIVSVFMAFQLLTSFLLGFFNARIYSERERDSELKESIKTFTDDVVGNISQLVSHQVSDIYSTVFNAISVYSEDSKPNIIESTGKPKQQAQKIVGFSGSNENRIYDNRIESTKEETEPTEKATKETGTQPEQKESLAGTAVCLYCGKPYVKNHNKQIYCCDECRGQACADRHHKTYYFNGKKYEPKN